MDIAWGERAPVKFKASTRASRAATVAIETHSCEPFFFGCLLFSELDIAAADLNLSRLVELGVSPLEEAFPLLARQVRTLERNKERKVQACTKTMAAYKTATKVREGSEKCDTVWWPLKANQ